MALLHPFSGNEAKAKEPINQDLMDLKFKENIENLESRLSVVESGSGASGSGGVDPREVFAEAEVKTDEAKYWKRRFHPSQNTLRNGANQEGFDIEGTNRNDRFIFPSLIDDYNFVNQTDSYLGSYLFTTTTDAVIQFKIKKGENFFGISYNAGNINTDRCEVFIDGVLASGYEDENGNTTTGFFSMNSSPTFFQRTNWFYGLDGEEHIISIKSNGASFNRIELDSIFVGYRSENPTISNTLKVYEGKARVKGVEVTYDEASFTFDEPVEGNANGRTDAIVIDSQGNTSKLETNYSNAQTQCKAEENITFSSGPVASLKVKNNWYFPNNGICLAQLPTGQTHLFSYASKSQPSIANHTLDGVIWASQPTEDFEPQSGFDGSGGAGSARGDLNINLYAKAPIEVTASNKFVDFSITVNGTTTVHAAQLAEGFYSADLLPIETAFKKAMQAAKPINGEYFLKYNKQLGLYEIGCNDPEVTRIDFLFSTGVNAVNSLHTTLGFSNSDRTLKTSYVSTTEVRHLARRVFEPSKEFDYCDSPKFKYSDALRNAATAQDALTRLGFPSHRFHESTNINYLIQYFPNDDAVGCSLSFFTPSNGDQSAFVQIDDGPFIYLKQSNDGINTNLPPRAKISSYFVSFPKGSRKISVLMNTGEFWHKDPTTDRLGFLGAREFYNKPAYEALTSSQQILHCIESAPISLYATNYGFNGGALYSPDNGGGLPTDDQINTITEVGSWGATTGATVFNGGGSRFTNTIGDYVDINFTLNKDGGGIEIKDVGTSIKAFKAGLFISNGTINESTDRVYNGWNFTTTLYYDQNMIGIRGLKAGTYTARLKHEAGTRLSITAIVIIDSEQPQKNAYVHADLNNTGQGLAYPVNVFRENLQRDSQLRTPQYLERSGYKEGRVSNINYSFNSPSFSNFDDSSSAFLDADKYFQTYTNESATGSSLSFSNLCKSLSFVIRALVGTTNSTQPFIDGVSTANVINQQVQVKGGSAPSSTRGSASRMMQKLFELDCSFSSGSTYTISDTRGLRDGMRVRIFDGTNYEDFTITNIVTNTSFDINQTASVITPASAELVQFFGFHNSELQKNNATSGSYIGIEYEPLPLFPSNFKKLVFRRKKLETQSIVFRSVPNGGDCYYPTFSDGVQANFSNSSIDVIAVSSTSGNYSMPYDLKNIPIGAGTLDIKITSTKEVYEDIDGMDKE